MKNFLKIFAVTLLLLSSSCKVSDHPDVIDDGMLQNNFGVTAPPISVSSGGIIPSVTPIAGPNPLPPTSAVAPPEPIPVAPQAVLQAAPPQARATFMPPQQKPSYQEPTGYGTYNYSDYHSYNPNYPPAYYAPNYNPYSNDDSYNPNRQVPKPQRSNRQ